MKRITVVFAVVFLSSFAVRGQKIRFEQSLTVASEKSTAQKKPLLILITARPAVNDNNFRSGMTDREVISTINENFISYLTNAEDTATRKIIRNYKVLRFPAFVFLDSQGSLLLKAYESSALPSKYLEMFSKAIFASKETSLSEFDKRFNSGYRDKSFLKEYINRRKRVGITENAKLIDEYVNLLTIGDLSKFEEVLFILEAGPTTDSKSYKLAHFDKKTIDSVYKNIPPIRRAAINNAIINNTMEDAVKERNFVKAQSLAQFCRILVGRNYAAANKVYSQKILQYYKAIRDTSNYFRQAVQHYDQHYMNISADSMKRMELKLTEAARKSLRSSENATDTLYGERIKRDIARLSSSSIHATDLNNAAWDFYIMGAKNPVQLTKALLWSKRSLELKEVSAFFDTLAHILYRLGFYSEAEATQLKAIKYAKLEKRNVKTFENELAKIRARTL